MHHRLARTIVSLTVAAVPVLGLATAAHAFPGTGFGQIPPVQPGSPQPGSPQPQSSPSSQNGNGAVAGGASDTTNPDAPSDLPLVDTLSSTDAQPSSSHSVVPVVLAIAVALAAIAGLGVGIVLKRRNA